jgi:hypothetical protein
MALYRLHRMKDAPRQQFRWAPHASGVSVVKVKDHQPGGEHEASSAYALWQQLRQGPDALQLGDVLELADGSLRIFKYVGFDEARWAEPVPVAQPDGLAAPPDDPAGISGSSGFSGPRLYPAMS